MKTSSLSSVGSYISYGRSEAKKRIGQHWLPLLLVGLAIILIDYVQTKYGTIYMGETDAFGDPVTMLNRGGQIIEVIGTVFAVWYGIGLMKMGLFGADDTSFSFSDMFAHSWPTVRKYSVVMFLFVLMVAIPGVVIGMMAGLAAYGSSVIWMILAGVGGLAAVIWIVYISCRVGIILSYVAVDHAETMTPLQMIHHAWNLGRGHTWKLFSTSLVAGLTNVLGVLAAGVGLLWTVPLTQIAVGKLYRDIDEAYHRDHPTGVYEPVAV